MRNLIFGLAIMSCGAACGTNQPSDSDIQGDISSASEPTQPSSVKPGEAGEPGRLPANRNLVAEGAIDLKGAQGAGQALQHFAALLEQKRFVEARALGEEDLTTAFAKDAEVHAEIGTPGEIEGAAGSTYVEIPIRFYGKHQDGSAFSQLATATLRRVSDIPGSTAAQRRWRIYRLEMQPAT